MRGDEEWTTYERIGFTDGAASLFDEGLAWRQAGVANVGYRPG